MTLPTIAGIQRYALFSPNHVGNDAAVFMAVMNYLTEQGCKTHLYTEQEFLTGGLQHGEQLVCTMMRSRASIRKLQLLEATGIVAVNSAHGIEHCTRELMTRLLLTHNVPHPASVIVDTGNPTEAAAQVPFDTCWVKRADFHAIHREDVTFVRSHSELIETLAEYALRGIERVVINEHLKGDLIKFYGVAGSDFFYHFYPQEGNHSKFGLEAINGAPSGIPFSVETLHSLCTRAAEVLQVEVYGGDCIVAPDGNIRIIDFNDFPSFAPCRAEAGIAIGKMVYDKALKLTNQYGQ